MSPKWAILGILLVFLFLYLAASGHIPGIEPERPLISNELPSVCPLLPPDELDILC